MDEWMGEWESMCTTTHHPPTGRLVANHFFLVGGVFLVGGIFFVGGVFLVGGVFHDRRHEVNDCDCGCGCGWYVCVRDG